MICPITYSKNDILLRNFLECNNSFSVSEISSMAIEYHALTGKYLPLIQVSTRDEHPTKKTRSLHIPDNSAACSYILSMREKGVSFKKVLFDVVVKGITTGTDTGSITIDDYLRFQLLIAEAQKQKNNGNAQEIQSVQKAGRNSTGYYSTPQSIPISVNGLSEAQQVNFREQEPKKPKAPVETKGDNDKAKKPKPNLPGFEYMKSY